MAQERVRWCKKCKVVFGGSACLQGHPNFHVHAQNSKEAGALTWWGKQEGGRSDDLRRDGPASAARTSSHAAALCTCRRLSSRSHPGGGR